MVEIKISSVMIGGRSYNKDKSGYPLEPTIYSGAEITWGAQSCIEHPDPTRLQLSLWVPKTHLTYLPTIGDVVELKGGFVVGGVTPSNSLFAGKVESIKLQDDHKPAVVPTSTRTNLVKNPSVETSLDSWATSNLSTISRYSVVSQLSSWTANGAGPSGDYLLRTSVTDSEDLTISTTSASMPVTPNKYVAFTAVGSVSSTNFRWRIDYLFLDKDGVLVSQGSSSTSASGSVYNLQKLTTSALVPATASNAVIRLRLLTSGGSIVIPAATAVTMYNDKFMVVQADTQSEALSNVATYFDGSFVDTSTKVNEWTGEANNSASIESIYPVGTVSGGYRINIVAADALAEAARMRLSAAPWPFEGVIERQIRIKNAAVPLGVAFQESTDSNSGYFEALNTSVIPRDVDSAPALETFQKTCMAAGRTVISVNNVVRPSYTLKLPTVLNLDMTGVANTYEWTGTPNASTSVKKVNGVVSRTNRATNPSANESTTGYSVVAGTGGAASLDLYSGGARTGTKYIGATWSSSPTGGSPALEYGQGMSGAISSKVSVAVWVKSGEYQYPTKSFKLVVKLMNNTTTVATYTSAVTAIPVDTWSLFKLENLNATGAYTGVNISVQPQAQAGVPFIVSGLSDKVFVDGLIIEQASTVGNYFDGNTVDKAATVYTSETSDVTAFESNEVTDVAFELDTSKVVNEVKVEMKKAIGSGGTPAIEDFDQVFTNESGSRRTTPQTRTISSELAVQDPYGDLSEPSVNTTMVLKGKLLLAAQSVPKWRVSDVIAPVLREVSESTNMDSLVNEDTRFGALVAIENTPDLLSKYMRVHAGRLFIGQFSTLELEVEPVEYSAPVPFTANTLNGDTVISNAVIGNFKNITSNDLRTIGAR